LYIAKKNIMECPRCNSEDIKKVGFTSANNQVYRCKTCKKDFVNNKSGKSRQLRELHPDISDTRYCPTCNEYLHISNFYKNKKGHGRYQSNCKSCDLLRIRLDRFKITEDKYNSFIINQGNRCKICGNTFIKTPHIDHDHVTGKVRGLLCGDCNRGLGGFKDNLKSLLSAIKYIKESLEN